MNTKEFAFDRSNYKLLLIGLVIIIVGFILMSGGGVDDTNEFSEDIFNFRSITLAQLVVLGGYGFVMYAIMKKPQSTTNQKVS